MRHSSPSLFLGFSRLYALSSIYTNARTCIMYSRSHLGWHFRMLFQSSKLERLFCHVSVKRDFRDLSFELWKGFRKCHPTWDWLYLYTQTYLRARKRYICTCIYIHIYMQTHTLCIHTQIQWLAPLKVPIHDFCCNVLQCCCSAEVCCSTPLHSKSPSMTSSLSEWQLYVHTHFYIYVYICTHICVNWIYICILVYMHIYTYRHMCIYICMYMHIWGGYD